MTRLRVAQAGLAGAGTEYLSALQSDERFDLVAVADADPERLRRFAEDTSLRTYEDYRSLIVESVPTGLDVLFVALEPFQSVDLLEVAAEHRVGVFHKAPLARTLGEAQRLVDRFGAADCPLMVPRFWQTDPAFAGLNDLMKLAGRVYAATADAWTVDEPAGWRGDSTRAGGGGLLNGAYEVVDMLVALLGGPESVYAQCSAAVSPGAPRKYDTEDTALVSLRFSEDRIGAVTAWRGAPEPFTRVALFGTESLVEVYRDRMTLTPRHGGSVEVREVQRVPAAAGAVRAFGAARLAEERKPAPAAQEHLPTMAVIEAAYLSAKTGAPESPGRLRS